jgi:3',5'-cyclic AMP phosphodiesterase CpdA
MRDMRERFLPLMDAYGVDMVLSGHSHSYERSYPVQGHYGLSGSLTTNMIIDAGDGIESGDGAYRRSNGTGVVYVVAGSSGKIGYKPRPSITP